MLVKNKLLAALLLTISSVLIAWANPPKLRRVCQSGSDNNIFFYPSTDTCTGFVNYYIWGNDGGGSGYILVDSIGLKNASQYIHVDANPAGVPKDWSYFISYQDSCSPPNTTYSDTLKFDRNGPDTIVIDSASVDILTNQVRLGWHKNNNKNFYRYEVYRFDVSTKTPISPPELRDTFLVDTSSSSNPQIGRLQYDITSFDSCGVSQVFEFNPHTTMFLSTTTDTCKKQISLSWTPYIGWASIRSYYVYYKENSGPYVLLDSLPPGLTSYLHKINLGNQHSYFVRAFQNGENNSSASSNPCTIQTRGRVDPQNTYISNVTAVNPDKNLVAITINSSPAEEYSSIWLGRSTTDNPNTFQEYSQTAMSGTSITLSDNIESKLPISLYRTFGVGLCGTITDTSNAFPTLVANAYSNGSTNTVTWNSLDGWDSGVAFYIIYRGTNNNNDSIYYEPIDTLLGSETTFTDNTPLEITGNKGCCYYIEAIQNAGSSHGILSRANSFSSCVVGELLVFVPNAFVPTGVNKFFRPKGSFIDYNNSSMKIYNRWGQLIKSITDISIGWDGTDETSNKCPAGVYVYDMLIIGTNGDIQNKRGSITLID